MATPATGPLRRAKKTKTTKTTLSDYDTETGEGERQTKRLTVRKEENGSCRLRKGCERSGMAEGYRAVLKDAMGGEERLGKDTSCYGYQHRKRHG